jgi:saccharopine dehydrogenase (NAD+, L-lysine-forming)
VVVELRHPDGFEFSAIPVLACLRQYLDGSIARPGVWLMGEVVEPKRLFADMERMEVLIKTTVEAAAVAPAHGALVTRARAADTGHRSAC